MEAGWKLASLVLSSLLGCAAAQDSTPLALDDSCVDVNRRAKSQLEAGHPKEAEEAISQALAGNASGLGPVCTGLILGNMAALMNVSGRFEEAERYDERSVKVMEGALGADAPGLLRSLQGLAMARLEQGRVGMARRAYQRMKRIRPERPEDEALVSSAAAMLLQTEGRSVEAGSEYVKAIAALEKAGLGKRADTALLLGSLGSLYIVEGRLDDAARALDGALSIVNSAADVVPMDRIQTMYLCAVLHGRNGDWQKVESEMREVVSLADQLTGLYPSYHAFLLHNYAQVLRKNHQQREARSADARAAAFRAKGGPQPLVDVTELSLAPKGRLK